MLVATDGAFPTAALFAATHPSRTTALVVLEGYADPTVERTEGLNHEESSLPMAAHVGHGGVRSMLLSPDMPWNEEIRATWARHERLAASPGTFSLCCLS